MAMLAALHLASPLVLLALCLLPLLWWLLRITPPAPRRVVFPSVRLLLGLEAAEETPAHTPLWLLALRLGAAALAILALAGPSLRQGETPQGQGPLLLVIDDGWAAAQAWPQRMAAAQSVLDQAQDAGRNMALLTTAPPADGSAPRLQQPVPAAELRPVLAALLPKPWGTDRTAAARLLAGVQDGTVVYLSDGIAADPAFNDALAKAGPVRLLLADTPGVLLLPPVSEAERMVARISVLPRGQTQRIAVLAQAADGRTLSRAEIAVPSGADHGEAAISLPPELRNQLARLVVEGDPSAGAVRLLDETARRRPVGLLAASTAADTPLIGALFYVRRALDPTAELREGDLATLLGRALSVLVMPDASIGDDQQRTQLEAWVRKGGTLIRFAGPALAAHPDTLLPVTLLDGDRQLGGAMSWTKPPGLAGFEAGSLFAGLTVPSDVHVTRQVLASPASVLTPAGQPSRVLARLEDGTPLVTQAPLGAGRLVLFHVTANADWSDLPLSGLFVDLLRRLVAQANGVAEISSDLSDPTPLPPVATLDGFGQLGPPPGAALAITARDLAAEPASPRHPPGLYGPEARRRARNLGDTISKLEPALTPPGAEISGLAVITTDFDLAPWLMGAALALLALDLLISLPMRGLWRVAAVLALLSGSGGFQPAVAQMTRDNPALTTRLAYLVTHDDARDEISRTGLLGLSEYVNRRTNAALGLPAAVQPGVDDLSFYPLLYWPIGAGDPPPQPEAMRALNDYTAHGGIILIDTRNAGSGEGFAPGADATLAQLGTALVVPALTPLTSAHVLARSFYLLQDFPGRYAGGTVWVQRDEDRSNDSVSPVIIGGHDWAAAWAVDDQGRNPYATLPGGVRQRVLAYRFGVNLVMYALTGNYKGDQVHIPALLERLGQ